MASGDGSTGSGPFEFRLLGPVQAIHGGRVLELGGVQARSILAVLLLHPGQVVPRGVIVRNSWSGDPPTTAGNLVAAYVSRLRTALSPAAVHVRLEAVNPGFRARVDPALIDAHHFTALLRQAAQERAAHEEQLAITHLEDALALWHGGTLALEDVEAEWLRAQADALQQQRFNALELLATLHYDVGHPTRTVTLLEGEAPGHPHRDGAIALLVRALTAAGEGAQAVQVADRAIDALDHAGLPVGAQLREARRQAQRPGPSSATTDPLRQLPSDTSAFTGRGQELALLLQLADSVCAAPSGTLLISAIDGMAGIGKTALAIRASHRLAGRFPDGQLFVDLHGFTQGLDPRSATDVLADVLRTLGVPPQQIPEDLTARAALYRDRLAGKRMLVVLDNAGSEEQIRPLLPGHPRCLVLITSRRRLKGLDEARVLSLDVLLTRDALALLRTIAGPGRIPDYDPLLEQIAELCGNLPLALRIAAALLRHRPSWSLAHLADKLRDARPVLTAFNDGDRDLAALFDLSYQALDDDQQRLYRHLGLHPGPDIDAYAAAALLRSTPAHTEHLLEDLIDHSLLLEPASGRYRMHDLIRGHTHALAGRDPEPDRQTAITNLLEYYQYTAWRASQAIARAPGSPPPSPEPAHAPALPDARTAQGWLRTERANLEAAVEHAHHHGHRHVMALAAGLTEIMLIDGSWPRAIAIHQAAATAAERLGDQTAQVGALIDLGRMQWISTDHPGAASTTARALRLSKERGSAYNHGRALANLGRVRLATGDPLGAEDALNHALHLFRSVGSDLGQANVLIEFGRVWLTTGNYPAAANAFTQAAHLGRDLNNGHIQAGALLGLADVQALTGDHPGAADTFARTLHLFRDLDHRFGEALALTGLGRMRLAIGDHPAAADALTHALRLFRDFGDHRDEAYALNIYAALLLATGDQPQALDLYRQALAMNRQQHKPADEATALEGIGECHLKNGDTQDGIDHLCQALEIYQRLGMRPDIERIQDRLATIDNACI